MIQDALARMRGITSLLPSAVNHTHHAEALRNDHHVSGAKYPPRSFSACSHSRLLTVHANDAAVGLQALPLHGETWGVFADL